MRSFFLGAHKSFCTCLGKASPMQPHPRVQLWMVRQPFTAKFVREWVGNPAKNLASGFSGGSCGVIKRLHYPVVIWGCGFFTLEGLIREPRPLGLSGTFSCGLQLREPVGVGGGLPSEWVTHQMRTPSTCMPRYLRGTVRATECYLVFVDGTFMAS